MRYSIYARPRDLTKIKKSLSDLKVLITTGHSSVDFSSPVTAGNIAELIPEDIDYILEGGLKTTVSFHGIKSTKISYRFESRIRLVFKNDDDLDGVIDDFKDGRLYEAAVKAYNDKDPLVFEFLKNISEGRVWYDNY